MKRRIYHELVQWQHHPARMPLLVRGARQIGKTHSVTEFGENNFDNIVKVNFELEPEYKQCFLSLKPKDIINAIAAISGQGITSGKTLVFLDEIQDCPEAIMSLRYFKELMPELHVIGAGSLLEFSLSQAKFSMPVGRIQYLYMKPLSFLEFVDACGYVALREQLSQTTLDTPLPLAQHEKLLQLVRQYALVGGMPEAVCRYVETGDHIEVQRIQTIILSTYRGDFGKYANSAQHKYLQQVFVRAPTLVGQQVKYSRLAEDMRSRDLKQAIETLNFSGVLSTALATSASGLPLSATVNEKKFKLIFLDTGLVSKTLHIGAHEALDKESNLISQGNLAEQLVGQELLAYADCYDDQKLNFWASDKKGSQAEVDYVTTLVGKIIPIEVKAGNTGRLKSLHLLRESKQLLCGVRISQQALNYSGDVLSVPFYLISQLENLIKEIS